MQALILAAGMGKRLGKDGNKCMVRVSEKSLFERCVQALKKAEIDKLVVVTGYNAEGLETFIKEHSAGLEVTFVRNEEYATTNNIWSLYLAREEMARDNTVLIESDLIFDESLLKKVVEAQENNLAVVAKLEAWMDGTTTLLDGNKITKFVSKKEFEVDNFTRSYKTVNIYKFDKNFIEKSYIPALAKYIEDHGRNEYYEMALKKLVDEKQVELSALCINEPWYEIDNETDLLEATKIFGERGN